MLTKRRPSSTTVIHRIADGAVAGVSRLFREAVARASDRVSLTRLADAYATGNIWTVEALLALPRWEKGLAADIAAVLFRTLDRAGTALSERPVFKADPPVMDFRFDVTNPEAVAWARNRSNALVTNILADTRAMLRSIIGRAFTDGIPPRHAARLIRDVIGLTERDGLAVDNMRRGLAEQGVNPSTILTRIGAYADRLHRQRALTIARTETLAASNQGQQQVWQQAAREGFLDPQDAKREWIITPDERLCDICAPMEGQAVGLNEPFQTGDGEYVMTPPIHPACRCTLSMVFADA